MDQLWATNGVLILFIVCKSTWDKFHFLLNLLGKKSIRKQKCTENNICLALCTNVSGVSVVYLYSKMYKIKITITI
jgi:hypothetical protein